MREEIKNWLESGQKDAETARYNLDGNKLEAAAFFAQQATEKALKALQIKKLGEFEKTHDLVALAKSVNSPTEIIRFCETITPFYVVTRYPDVKITYDRQKVSSVINESEKVREWVEQNLK